MRMKLRDCICARDARLLNESSLRPVGQASTVGGIALLTIASLLFVGCEERVKPSVVPLPNTELPSQESWNSTITFSDSERIKAILWAGHISRFSQQRYTLLQESLRVDFFDSDQKHTSLLTAKRGRVNDATEDFAAYGNVIVISDGGTTLKTDSLFWNNSNRKIYTQAFVDIVSPTEHIMGTGMESDQNLKNYKIYRVTGSAVTKD
ncbi:MAG: LPS export ABC transporter periplasmic protein LptC [Bacteroidota bacterium]